MGDRFPNSARTAWTRTQYAPKSTKPELERERRLLVEILVADLPAATLEQLHQVAAAVGRTDQWLHMVATEARHPGAVGKAVLRAGR